MRPQEIHQLDTSVPKPLSLHRVSGIATLDEAMHSPRFGEWLKKRLLTGFVPKRDKPDNLRNGGPVIGKFASFYHRSSMCLFKARGNEALWVNKNPGGNNDS